MQKTELPHSNRLVITELEDGGVNITIPPGESGVGTLLIAVFSIALVYVLWQAIGNPSKVGESLFTWLTWLAILIMIFFALRKFIWEEWGTETITINPDAITLNKEGAIFYAGHTHNLQNIKNLRVEIHKRALLGPGRGRSVDLDAYGLIYFDYDGVAIQFASRIMEEDARYILKQIRKVHLQGGHKA